MCECVFSININAAKNDPRQNIAPNMRITVKRRRGGERKRCFLLLSEVLEKNTQSIRKIVLMRSFSFNAVKAFFLFFFP